MGQSDAQLPCSQLQHVSKAGPCCDSSGSATDFFPLPPASQEPLSEPYLMEIIRIDMEEQHPSIPYKLPSCTPPPAPGPSPSSRSCCSSLVSSLPSVSTWIRCMRSRRESSSMQESRDCTDKGLGVRAAVPAAPARPSTDPRSGAHPLAVDAQQLLAAAVAGSGFAEALVPG